MLILLANCYSWVSCSIRRGSMLWVSGKYCRVVKEILVLLSGVCACLSPSCPELSRCSPRSQPNTLSRRMPLCFSFCLVGRDFMKERKKVISFPCFLDTEGRKQGRIHVRSVTLQSVRLSFHTWTAAQGLSLCALQLLSNANPSSFCMCSFLEAFLNTTSQATTKESSTSSTSVLRSPSQQNQEQTALKTQTALIRCLGKIVSFLNCTPVVSSASERLETMEPTSKPVQMICTENQPETRPSL